MKPFAILDIENKGNYVQLLKAIAKLSGLFSESSIPFLNYRVAENIFCKSFDAQNLSRSDTSFDAKINSIGIGLKTFISNSNSSNEKIAEFNSKSKEFQQYKGFDLALILSEERNKRIQFAKRIYNIEKSIYHIVARKQNELILFETDYNEIDISNLNFTNDSKASLQFTDGVNDYSYNYSKSTLYRKFIIPQNAYKLPVEIILDPFSLLLDLFKNNHFNLIDENNIKGENYIILPLYGKDRIVYERSGLNQWNAEGRKRDINEVYIPVPSLIHHKFPNFFPPIEDDKKHFKLHLPNGNVCEASMCQTSWINYNGVKINKGKGLMTKSNKGLGDWLLRQALQLKEGELVTIEMLDKIEYDSVLVTKLDSENYKIDIMKTGSYEEFISENN